MSALLPCPFCGGAAEIWRANSKDPARPAWVACVSKCAVLVSKEYQTTEEAVAAWNRRAVTDAMKVRALFAFQHSREYDLGLKLGHALEAALSLERDPKSNEVGE